MIILKLAGKGDQMLIRMDLKNKGEIAGDGKDALGLHGVQKTEMLAEQAIPVDFAVGMEVQTGTDEYIQQNQAETGDEKTLLSYGVHQSKSVPEIDTLVKCKWFSKEFPWQDQADVKQLNTTGLVRL